MIFDNKTISEITDKELTDLIVNRQEENLWIEFKSKYYDGYMRKNEDYKREVAKDVTAMANAEGGYILFGVDANNNRNFAKMFVNMPDVKRMSDSLRDTCQERIRPSITKLEVKSRTTTYQGIEYNIIIVHIPFSENRPYGFHSRGTLNFVKRYDENIREFDIEEFIPDLLKRYDLPTLGDINRRLDSIEKQTTDIIKKMEGTP